VQPRIAAGELMRAAAILANYATHKHAKGKTWLTKNQPRAFPLRSGQFFVAEP
jgi:hypothetical protein